MTFGEEIAKRRKEKGLTQKELAKLLNRYEKTIGNWERDKNLPDEKMRREVCRLLDIDPKDASLEYDRELLKDEQKIITIYRGLDEDGKKLIYSTAQELDRERAAKEVLEQKLNKANAALEQAGIDPNTIETDAQKGSEKAAAKEAEDEKSK